MTFVKYIPETIDVLLFKRDCDAGKESQRRD